MVDFLKAWIIGLLFLNSGCSWLALSDTSNRAISQSECDNKLSAVIEREKKILNSRYLGFSKEQIVTEQGKPRKVINEQWIYADGLAAEEVWLFPFIINVRLCGRYAYSCYFYFVDNKVVAIK